MSISKSPKREQRKLFSKEDYSVLDDFITTPYEKVLKILQEIKKFLSPYQKSKSLTQKLDWVISIISSHSLYTYDITNQKELLDKYQKEMPEIKHFISYLENYNEKINLSSKKLKSVSNLHNGLQTPSRGVKRKRMTISFGFSNRLGKDEDQLPASVQRKSNYFLTNCSNPLAEEPNFHSAREIDGTINEDENSDPLIFDNEESDNINNSSDNLSCNANSVTKTHNSNDGLRSLTTELKPIFNPFVIEKMFNNAGYNPKVILTPEFDIFELKSIVGYENVMAVVGKVIFDYFDFSDEIINLSKLDTMLMAISNGYNESVLYHNAMHATDVTQTVFSFIINSNFEEVVYTNVNDILSIITACLGHDLCHPGTTNPFNVNTLSDLAITYNDISVLENFHAASLFRIIRQAENNIFDNFSAFDYTSLRKRIISQILATDMFHHGKVLGIIKSRMLEMKNSDTTQLVNKDSKNMFDEQGAVFDFLVHTGDIAHNAKKFKVSLQWVELLTNEFWKQGDRESSLGVPISFLCDRNDADIPKSQIGFIKAFVSPVFEVLSTLFPTLGSYMTNVNDNLSQWTTLYKDHRRTGWTPERKSINTPREEKKTPEKGKSSATVSPRKNK